MLATRAVSTSTYTNRDFAPGARDVNTAQTVILLISLGPTVYKQFSVCFGGNVESIYDGLKAISRTAVTLDRVLAYPGSFRLPMLHEMGQPK